MAWTRTRLEVPAITGDPSVLLAAPPPDGGWTPRLGRTVTIGTFGRDRIATTGPLSEPTIPVSPQAARPAVSEREIGAGGVPGCSGMPRPWKSQPARQSSRIQGAGHRRTPWRRRCRQGEDRPMGAGKPGLQRPPNDRRFPPLEVTRMPSYGWTTYKGVVVHLSGPLFEQPQRFSLRGRSPRRCGPGCSPESALEAGWHGLPESSGVKPRAAPASRVPLAPGAAARRTRGVLVE